MREYDQYYENQLENSPSETCSNCQRFYDEIDFDFQSCSKCGWDAEEKEFKKEILTRPTQEDYLNGDADILTGQWY